MTGLIRKRLAQLLSFLLIFCLFTSPAFAQLGTIQKQSTGAILDSGSNKKQEGSSVSNLIEDKDKKYQYQPQQSMMRNMQGLAGIHTINVHVLGDVANPGLFKTSVSDRAADVVKLAGLNRPTTRIIQVRHDGEKTRFYDLYQYHYFGNLKQNPFLKDNDVIFVPPQKGAIRIEGSITRPGVYELWGEKTLYQLVKLSGGFTHGMSQMHPIKVVRFTDGGEKFVLDVVQKKSTMKRFKIMKGDIVVVPDIINASKKFDYTVESIPGEHHIYPTSIPDVFVIGAVANPGPYPYKSHLTIKDYIGFSGASADANFSHVKIIREGKKKRKKIYDKVQAGDVIIVKQKGMNEFLKYISIASTLMSVTLSAIVLKDVIKNQ